ncbi:MAG: hypothetical protein K8F58_05815 [Bauldia sp.]|nr:hypothetical protein [Bauldia sp.]
MLGISARLIVALALLLAGVWSVTGVAAASDGMARPAVEAGRNGCEGCGQGAMTTTDCGAACALCWASLAEAADIGDVPLRLPWRLADRDAAGLRPGPDPAPPRG